MVFEQNFCSLSFDDPITKTYFFHKIGLLLEIPVIYFDFDLLYSGYLASNILPQNDNLEIIHPQELKWQDQIVEVMKKISQKQSIVIIDSLNGFFSTLIGKKDSGRIINSVIMLLICAAQKTNSSVMVGAISKFKKDEGWILSGIGRHVIEIQQMNLLSVRKKNENLQLVLVNHDNTIKSIVPLDDLDLV